MKQALWLTGANGFIGRHLGLSLKDAYSEVRYFTNNEDAKTTFNNEDSFLGKTFITSNEGGLNPNVRAGISSVTKFIKSICRAKRGRGRPIRIPIKTIEISATLHES